VRIPRGVADHRGRLGVGPSAGSLLLGQLPPGRKAGEATVAKKWGRKWWYPLVI